MIQIGVKEKGNASNTFLVVCAGLAGVSVLVLIVSFFLEEQGTRYPGPVTDLWPYLQSAPLTDTLWIYALLWNMIISTIVILWGLGQLLKFQHTRKGS
ncbi:hypothetical protein [uncultured Sneathiella sp.]|jgi:hypothetical protein|uniref:hypothetical protein n=1 Tax=uncultured Sneathiella sp. TaxID=879315 RepID=UPI0030EB4460|tara:strand:- start:331 stop:624 length:294 start_codon:yes stop_codon:yes gene_type:complete